MLTMKIQSVTILNLVAFANAHTSIHRILAKTNQNPCEACFNLIDDARDCLRECNGEPYWNYATGGEDGTILNECLDPNRKDRDQGTISPGVNAPRVDNVENIKDLVDCCEDGLDNAGVKWDDTCRDTFEQVEACLAGCFDGCLVENTKAWFDCVQLETGNTKKDSQDLTGSKSCSRQSCLSGFVDEEDKDTDNGEGNEIDTTLQQDFEDSNLLDAGNSKDDVFDVSNIAGIFEKIQDDDLQDCSLLDNFLESACRVGDTCCEACNEELASALDCLLNSIVAPFVSAVANLTSPLNCPVDEQCDIRNIGAPNRRQLQADTIAALNSRGEYLPKSSDGNDMVAFFEKRRLEGTSSTADDVQYCIDQMNRDIIAFNMTYATNKYMECTTAAALSQLEDEPESASASTVYTMFAVVAAIVVALF